MKISQQKGSRLELATSLTRYKNDVTHGIQGGSHLRIYQGNLEGLHANSGPRNDQGGIRGPRDDTELRRVVPQPPFSVLLPSPASLRLLSYSAS